MTMQKSGQSFDRTMTDNNERQHNEQNDTRNIIQNHNNNYISNGAGRVQPGRPVRATPADFERIRETYADNIGTMTAAIGRMIERALDHGLTVDEICMAIEETGFAPRPTAWYLRAILEAWAENGVTISKIRHQVKANAGTRWWRDENT